MKKLFVIVCSLFFISFSVAAQQKPHFGFHVGFDINQAKLKPDEGIDKRQYAGFDGGILAEFYISRRVKLQPEVNYTMAGGEFNNGSNETSIKLGYITIPILVKWNVARRFNLFAGPQHCILISAWNDPSGGGPSTQIKGQFKFTDLVGVVGGEYSFNNNMFLGIRYNHGFEQIVEDGLGFEMSNRYLSFRLGYVFR